MEVFSNFHIFLSHFDIPIHYFLLIIYFNIIFQVKLTEFQSLPPLFRQTPTAVQELVLASRGYFYLFFRSCVYRLSANYSGCVREHLGTCGCIEYNDWRSGSLWKTLSTAQTILLWCKVCDWCGTVSHNCNICRKIVLMMSIYFKNSRFLTIPQPYYYTLCWFMLFFYFLPHWKKMVVKPSPITHRNLWNLFEVWIDALTTCV